MPEQMVLSVAGYLDQFCLSVFCASVSSARQASLLPPRTTPPRPAASQLGPTCSVGGPRLVAPVHRAVGAKQLARMNPGPSRNLGSNRARLQRRRDNPLLLRTRPAPATLHRRDNLNRLRHRTSPGDSPRTSPNDLPAQGGSHRMRTAILTCGVLSGPSNQLVLNALPLLAVTHIRA
jgi:hypothetical protein